MAAPSEITCKNLDGKFQMNKTISDDFDSILALQGVSWFTRKAIQYATITLTIREYQQDSVYHIDITSVASGLSTTQENRTLDFTYREHNDRIFGLVVGRSQLTNTQNIPIQTDPLDPDDKAFLLGEKLKDGAPSPGFVEPDLVQSFVRSTQNGWTAEQAWNFEMIEGKRYYTRRILVRKGSEVRRARLVYDYKGSVEAAKKQEEEADDGLAYGEE